MAGRPTRQDEPCEDPPLPAAVHPGGLQHLPRDLGEVVPQQEDRERQPVGDVEEHHARDRAEEPQLRRRVWRPAAARSAPAPPAARPPAGRASPGRGTPARRRRIRRARRSTTTSTVVGTEISTVFQNACVIRRCPAGPSSCRRQLAGAVSAVHQPLAALSCCGPQRGQEQPERGTSQSAMTSSPGRPAAEPATDEPGATRRGAPEPAPLVGRAFDGAVMLMTAPAETADVEDHGGDDQQQEQHAERAAESLVVAAAEGHQPHLRWPARWRPPAPVRAR